MAAQTSGQQTSGQQTNTIDELLQLAEADILALALLAAAAWFLPRPFGMYLTLFLLIGWVSTHPAAIQAFNAGWSFIIRNAFYGGTQ